MQGFTNYDEETTALSLVKHYQMQCEDKGDITLPKDSFKIILETFIKMWANNQSKTRMEYKKVKNGR